MSDSLDGCLACGHKELEYWAESSDVEYFTGEERYTFRRCVACSSLSISPVPLERLAQIYPPDYYSYDSRDNQGIAQRIKAYLDRRFFRAIAVSLPGTRLSALDVGGGAGLQLDSLKAADSRLDRTVIVDLDEGAKKSAEEAGHEFHCTPVEEFHTHERFDVILMLNLIEHVAQPAAVLRAAGELLTEQGVIVIKTPNIQSLDARLFRHRDWGGYHCPRHWVLFSRDIFTRCARSAGLEVTRFSYEQGAPFWATGLMSRLHRAGLITLSRDMPVFRHPLFPAVLTLFACLEVPRSWFFKTSQMLLVLKRAG